MSAHPGLPDGSPTRHSGAGGEQRDTEEEQRHDVWVELFSLVHGLGDYVGLALQAFTPTDDKAVSAITKKRLVLRSLHGLKQSQSSIETLLEHLKALQAASQTWQRSMMYASKSHQELMEQVETTTAELHKTNERLRAVEAQRLTAVREAELLKARVERQETGLREAQMSVKQREEELETLQFSIHELQSANSIVQQNSERLQQAATDAEDRAQAATAALDDAKAEAAKAQALAERHQQVVAKLTADNLVFLMQLKKAEADLAAANQERAQLRLAAEKQRGPWFDQVRAGVEERVRQALQRSQELELSMERREAEHATQMEAVQSERAKLEELLGEARQAGQELQQRLDVASESRRRAESLTAAAEAAVREARRDLESVAAENRVLQESIRSMRQECTERWVNEQAALGRVDGLEQRIQELQQRVSQQEMQIAALQQQLDTQAAINRQLMARKEEVEWQLMAAMAKVNGGAGDQPVPLNLRVSGLLQVGGSGGGGGTNSDNRQHGSAADPSSGAAGGLARNDQPGPSAAAPEPGPSADGVAGARSASRAASGGGGMDPARQGSAATGSAPPLNSSVAPQPHAGPIRAIPTASAQASGQHTEHLPEHQPFPAHNRLPSSDTHGSPQAAAAGTTGAVRKSGGGGSGGMDSPSRTRSWRHPGGPAGGVDSSALMPEPSLLIPIEDLVTISHARARGDAAQPGPAGDSSGRGEAFPPPPPQGQQQLQQLRDSAGLRAEQGAGARGFSGNGGLGVQVRWTSIEGASTVVSSPPSSVALSTEPGSPDEAPSSIPSESSSREPTAAAGVIIRTALTGPRWPGNGRGAAAGAGPLAPDRDGSQAPMAVAAHGAAVGYGAAAAAQLDGSQGGAGGPLPERRGSLHDGGDIWLPNVPSSSSSDDSDFFFSAGVVVHRESRVGPEPRGAHTPAQQAQLFQLQQRLQLHLQEPAGAAVTAAAAIGSNPADGWPRQAVTDQGAQAGRRPQAAASDAQVTAARRLGYDDDDVFRTAAQPQHGGGGSSITIRAAIPARPTAANSLGRSPATTAGHASDDASIGVLGILKGNSTYASAGLRSGGSPLHPVFSARQDPAAPPRTAGPSSAQQQPASPPTSAAPPVSADSHSQGAPAQAGPSQPQPTVALLLEDATRRHALRSSGGGAPADTDPIPARVQAGPPFYATGLPLDISTAAALERWAISAGGHPPHAAPQEVGSVPPSPARSTTSLRSPRSPPHPAIVVVQERDSKESKADGDREVTGAAVNAEVSRDQGSTSREAGASPRNPLLLAAAAAAATTSTSTAVPLRPAAVTATNATDRNGPDRAQAATLVERVTAATAGEAAASGPPSRPRVSFHGLDGRSLAAAHHGEGGVAATGAGRAPVTSSMSSSTGSLVQGTGGAHRASSSSIKSVRFSDHEPADDLPQQLLRTRRDSQELPGLGAASTTPSHRASSSSHGSEGLSPSQYRSRGPVPHPAMVGVSTQLVSPAAGGVGSETEAMPPKRHSAVGIVTTAVPRASTGPGQ